MKARSLSQAEGFKKDVLGSSDGFKYSEVRTTGLGGGTAFPSSPFPMLMFCSLVSMHSKALFQIFMFIFSLSNNFIQEKPFWVVTRVQDLFT